MWNLLYQSLRGRAFQIRAVTTNDTWLLSDLLTKLSPATLRLRFMTPQLPLSQEAAWQRALKLTFGQPALQKVLIATIQKPDGEQVVALAELWRSQEMSHTAEIALLVRDDFQREGIGTEISRQLLHQVLQLGFTSVRADFLAENAGIRRLISKLGLPYTTQTSGGATQLEANLRPFYS